MNYLSHGMLLNGSLYGGIPWVGEQLQLLPDTRHPAQPGGLVRGRGSPGRGKGSEEVHRHGAAGGERKRPQVEKPQVKEEPTGRQGKV